jgi:hypothetical protein
MSRFIASFALALGCVAVAAHAQDTTVKSRTKTTGGDAQTVTYTGCVQTGTESRTYILDKVVPVSRTTTTDAAGATAASTTYMLVPGEKVEVQQHVGHKVEVTGTLTSGGNVKSETKTNVDRENAPDTKTREKVETRGSMPQFRVTSIKSLSERCE